MRVLNLKYFSHDSLIDEVIVHSRSGNVHVRAIIGGIYYSIFDGNQSYQASSQEQVLSDFAALNVLKFSDVDGEIFAKVQPGNTKDIVNHTQPNAVADQAPNSMSDIFNHELTKTAAENIKHLTNHNYASHSFAI
jgi:hypothetical protein